MCLQFCFSIANFGSDANAVFPFEYMPSDMLPLLIGPALEVFALQCVAPRDCPREILARHR